MLLMIKFHFFVLGMLVKHVHMLYTVFVALILSHIKTLSGDYEGIQCTCKAKLRIGSCLACVYRVMDARGKFGEHKRSVRVARGIAESNSSFLSALQTSQVHP